MNLDASGRNQTWEVRKIEFLFRSRMSGPGTEGSFDVESVVQHVPQSFDASPFN